jgi:hypothetical protein
MLSMIRILLRHEPVNICEKHFMLIKGTCERQISGETSSSLMAPQTDSANATILLFYKYCEMGKGRICCVVVTLLATNGRSKKVFCQHQFPTNEREIPILGVVDEDDDSFCILSRTWSIYWASRRLLAATPSQVRPTLETAVRIITWWHFAIAPPLWRSNDCRR